jgi:hypothetical protein
MRLKVLTVILIVTWIGAATVLVLGSARGRGTDNAQQTSSPELIWEKLPQQFFSSR